MPEDEFCLTHGYEFMKKWPDRFSPFEICTKCEEELAATQETETEAVSKITETITFTFDDEEQQKRFHEKLEGKDEWRDASMRLCDALDSILHEDSDKTEQARLTDRVIASEVLHLVRSKLLPQS